MEVNARLIKEQRNSRAWTQQHLADVCGVSLRTVQRIERYGTCSVDTLMSLSAVFEMDKQQLLTEVAPVIEQNDTNHSKIGITFILAISLGMLLGAAMMYAIIG